MSLRRVLVANRGEIALRIVQACQALGIEAVQAYSEADRGSRPVRLANRAVCIGPGRSSESYLDQDRLIATALATGCDAIHPGYGFLSERPGFPAACESAGITFVGPTADTVRTMGNKLRAREVAAANGIPLVPGSPEIERYHDAEAIVAGIGLPVLFKAAAGGGGRGIRVVNDMSQLKDVFQSAAAEAEAAFGDGSLYVERYIQRARHIEVQVFGDGNGRAVHLGERDCSLQRRYQKIVEEAPASGLAPEARAAVHASAVRLAEAIAYRNAGTVEFIFDDDREEHHFLEMNTRIQVEHPVTEAITGLDLIREQLRLAGGEPLRLEGAADRAQGHAIECRINAESPAEDFRPSPGKVTRWAPPEGTGIRVDSHCEEGYIVSPFYDSMLGKLVVYGSDRADAVARTRDALQRFTVEGVATSIPFLTRLVEHPAYQAGDMTTRWVEEHIEELLPPIPADTRQPHRAS